MKIALSVFLVLCGCSSTTVRDSEGHVLLHSQANAASLTFVSGSTSLTVLGLDHSGPTEAGGRAFSHGVNAVGGAASSAVLAAGSSGLFRAGVSTASRLVIPTAAVASNYAAKPPPKATPAPAKDPSKIWPITSP